MFNRESNGDAGLPEPQSHPIPAEAVGATAKSNTSPFEPAEVMSGSVIGTDLTILGQKITIISQKSLQIDGDIRGDVSGKRVTIGQEGSVIGTVSSETVDVHGGVRGAIRALSVTLHPTAQVDGEIAHQTLIIAEGAQLEGRIRRPKDVSELKPNLDTNAQPSAPPPSGKGAASSPPPSPTLAKPGIQ